MFFQFFSPRIQFSLLFRRAAHGDLWDFHVSKTMVPEGFYKNLGVWVRGDFGLYIARPLVLKRAKMSVVNRGPRGDFQIYMKGTVNPTILQN